MSMDTGYRFTGADYNPLHDYFRLATHLDCIRDLMLDGEWRTPAEISEATALPPTSDITKQLRHLRYPEHGRHEVERRRRGNSKSGLYEYRVHEAGTGSPRPRNTKRDDDLRAAEYTVQLLADALRMRSPNHPLLIELGL